MHRPNGKPLDILLVEDNPGDVELAREALAVGDLPNRLHVVGDGVEALAFLRRQGRYEAAARPDLILLDLNLPRKDGREVLREVKGDAGLRVIPVVVLTTSGAEEDVAVSYHLHANCFITKPPDFDGLARVVRALGDFWSRVAALPPAGEP